MGMVADMILTIAIVAVTPGAIAELQLRVGNIGPAADGAAVVVGGFGLGNGGLVRAGGGEGDHGGRLLGFGWALLPPEQPGGIDSPGYGEDIHHILAEEKEIVRQSNQGEQAEGENTEGSPENHRQQRQDQVDQSQDPGLHRDDKEQQELGIGVKCGVGQEQAQVQVEGIGLAAEDHAEGIHHQYAAEVKQIEPQGAPAVFDGFAQGAIADQRNDGGDEIAGIIGKGKGKQPPNLTGEDPTPIETQYIVKNTVLAEQGKEHYQDAADGKEQHQMGDSLVMVAVAEPLKTGTKFFQWMSSPENYGKVMIPFYEEKVYNRFVNIFSEEKSKKDLTFPEIEI